MQPSLPRPRTLVLAAAMMLGPAAGFAGAQVTFSIDYRGVTIGAPSSFPPPAPISAGDILGPATVGLLPVFGPLPPPGIVVPVGPPGLFLPATVPPFPPCVPAPAASCLLEVDALSYGMDFDPAMAGALAGRWVFSVDEFAVGIPGSPLPPAVWTEGPLAPGSACADVFEGLGVPAGPVGLPVGPGMGNTGIIDGNGVASPTGGSYPGLGLIEPRPAGAIIGGDNLDAVDVDTPPGVLPIFISLDAAFFDPLLGIFNTGSAAANGYLPGMILQSPPSPGAPTPVGNPPGSPGVYAVPPVLGLDLPPPLGGGPMSDDLDALVLIENGVDGFQPAPGPLSPIPDVVYFSVRRGSAVIGVPDSLFGLLIEPGDILTLPVGPGLPPSIYIAAEWLGLATVRGPFPVLFGDDLDALDCVPVPMTGVPFCFGDGAPIVCGCLNPGVAGNGCANSVNAAGANLASGGSASLGGDTVVLSGTGMSGATCIFLQGTAQVPPIAFGDGMRCIGGTLLRLSVKPIVGGAATYPVGADPSVSAMSTALGFPIAAATLRFYQTYYRDAAAFACAPPATFNVTNGLSTMWMP